jgi:chromate transporter
MMVERERWLSAREFQDAVAATSLLPGHASTQLAIFCARAVAGIRGAIVGGLAFIVPGFVLIVLLAELFLAHGRNDAVRGASAGVAAAVVVVIVVAGIGFARSYASIHGALLLRSVAYALAGAAATVSLGPWVLAVLLGSGIVEVALRLRRPAAIVWLGSTAKLGALAWTAFKIADAVALGQLTPGPVVLTVSVVGYAVAGVAGAALAAAVAFAPSFAFVLVGAPYFAQLRERPGPRAFLDGAGPAAVGAIFGAAALLAPQAWKEWWQPLVIVAAVVAALLGRSSFFVLALGIGLGLLAAAVGLPLPH